MAWLPAPPTPAMVVPLLLQVIECGMPLMDWLMHGGHIMFLSPHTTFSAVSFIGAGLSMVAHGASAAVGLVELSDAGEAPAQPSPQCLPRSGADSGLAQCLGRRLDVHRHQGC